MLYGSVGRVGLRALSGTSFSPLSLFANGEQGVWLDNSDFTTLFQDAAGTTPVTGYEQFVGLRLDKSKSGVGTNGAKRVNLLSWTEAFENAAWTNVGSTTTVTANNAIAPDGTLTADRFVVAGADGVRYQPVSVQAGATYTFSCWLRGTAGETLGFGASNSTSVGATNTPITLTADWVRYTHQFTITSSGTANLFPGSTYIGATARTFWVWGADLRLASEAATLPTYQRITDTWYNTIPGNHAYQTTTTARAVLSARYNLLTHTEQFDNAAWTAVGLASRGKSGTAPDGISLWNVLTEDTGTSAHCVYGTSFAVTAGVIYTVSVYVNAGTRRYVSLRGFYSTTGNAWITFDTASASINANAFVTNSGYESLGGGVYRIWLTSNVQTTKANDNIVIAGSNVSTAPAGGSATGNSYLGDGSTIIAWGADCRVANESSALPVYQRVGAAVNGTSTSIGTPDYDTVGFPAYLRYDGGDWYQTNSIDFSTGATNPPALGPNLNPSFSAYGLVALGTWAASGANYVFTDTVGGQVRPGVEWPTSSLAAGTYKIDIVVASITGASQLRLDGLGSSDILVGTGTTSRIVSVTTLSKPRFRLEDTSTTIGDGFAITSVSVVAVDANYAPDKMSVFAGVRKLSDALTGVIVELSSDYFTSNGSFILTAPPSNGVAQYGIGARGNNSGYAAMEPFTAPTTNIVTELFDIGASSATDELRARVNGAAVTLTGVTGSLGTGNFGNYPLYIGARSGPSLWFTGREYETIVLGRAVTATELANTEGYMETQTFGKDMAYVYSDELTTATGDLITAADGDQIYMTVTYQ